jgi:hypothetical protein
MPRQTRKKCGFFEKNADFSPQRTPPAYCFQGQASTQRFSHQGTKTISFEAVVLNNHSVLHIEGLLEQALSIFLPGHDPLGICFKAASPLLLLSYASKLDYSTIILPPMKSSKSRNNAPFSSTFCFEGIPARF